jgi:hypothetical protein
MRDTFEARSGDPSRISQADTLTSSELPRVAAPPTADDMPEEIRLGRFTLLRVLGRGGMGVVYTAYDELLDRVVAIKKVRGDGDDTSLLARVLREAKALAKLSHPNVVQIHDVGEIDGEVFIAMEYVDGPTLRAWAEARRAAGASCQELLPVLIEAGRGLAAAHAAGLVHRDFKPKTHPPPLTPRHSPKWPRISKQRGFTRGGRVSGCLCMPRRYPKFCQKHGVE